MSFPTMISPANTNTSDKKDLNSQTDILDLNGYPPTNNVNPTNKIRNQNNLIVINSNQDPNIINNTINPNLSLPRNNKKNESSQNLAMAVDLPKITTTSYQDTTLSATKNNSNKKRANFNMQQIEDDEDLKQFKHPIIELATYAETDVYECYVRGFESNIVMRRVRDDWINITQVLKLAKFPKTQRSKILEREVIYMQHEKVQGGYGRFQGTWISLADAKTLVEKYSITNVVVVAVINFVLDRSNPPQRRVKNSVLRKNSPGRRIASPSSYKKTPKKNKNTSSNNSKLLSTTSFNGSNAQVNPSPLHNLAFETPRQSQLNSQNPDETFEIDSGKQETGNHEPSSNSTISRLSSDGTPLPQNYATSSQKPLQFYPVPTNLNNNNNNNNNNVNMNQNQNQNPNNNGNNGKLPNRHNFNRNQVLNIISPQNVNNFNNQVMNPNVNNSINQGNNNNPNFVANNGQQTMNDNIINNLKNDKSYSFNKTNRSNNNNNGTNTNTNPNSFNIQGSNPNQPQNYIQNNPTSNSSSSIDNINNNIPSQQTNFGIQNTSMNEMNYRDLILQSLTVEMKEDGSYLFPQELYHPPPNFNVDFEIDAQGHTALHWAAAMANIHLLKLLIALNANILYCNDKGFNAISKAIFYNNNFKCSTFQELASILNICLITPDKNGRLPVHYLVELSVNSSKDPVVINTYLEQILQEISKRGVNEVQRVLSCQDNSGNTVLHLCALNSNLSLFNKFYLLGVSTDLLNNEGKSALEIMSGFNSTPVVSQPAPLAQFNQASTPRVVLEPEVSINMTQSDISSNKISTNNSTHPTIQSSNTSMISNVVPRTTEKMNPYKFLQRRAYLNSHHNMDDSYSKANNTTLTLSKEDISVLDDIITSSAIKGEKPTLTQSILQSPVVQSRLQNNDENARFLSKFLNTPSPEKRKIRKFRITDDNDDDRKKVSKVGCRINGLSRRLVDAINDDMGDLEDQIKKMENQISAMDENIEKCNKSYKRYCSLIGMGDVKDVKTQMNVFKNALTQNRNVYIRSIEKSQALNLASLVQKEEEGFRQNTTNPNKAGQLRDAVTLTVLQFKKHMWLKRLSEDITSPKSVEKINKYKQLIGSTYDNIDSKLDDIEADLKAAA